MAVSENKILGKNKCMCLMRYIWGVTVRLFSRKLKIDINFTLVKNIMQAVCIVNLLARGQEWSSALL